MVVDTGQSLLLTASVRNTRTRPWRFVVRARVSDSTGETVADYITTLSTPLEPSAETFVSWVHVVRTPGDYLIEFSTWKDPSFAAGGVLDRKPSPPEVLIAGQDPARFQLGQAVVTTIDLEVRQGPGHAFPEVTNPSYAGHAPAGTTGAVVGGPVSSAGTTWWRVQYTPGYVGWSSESGLSGR